MLCPGDRVLLAVSGGVDSVVLLHLFHQFRKRWDISIGAAHFDHRLRGAESDRDREFISNLAEEMGVKLHLGRWKREEEDGSGSLQVRARKARFAFFERIISEAGYTKLGLGHNRDDQVETVLMALMRGYGFKGLRGIQAVSGNRIHPLIVLTRREIVIVARENELSWVEDSSNRELKYLRNRVRHELLPTMRGIFPDCEASLLKLGEDAGETTEWLEEQINGIWKTRVIKSDNSGIILDIYIFLQYFYFLRKYLLMDIFRKLSPDYRPSAQSLSKIENLCHSRTGGLWRAGPVEILHDRRYLRFRTAASPEIDISMDIGGSYVINGLKIELKPTDLEKVKFSANPSIEFIDMDSLRGGLRARNWRAGDRFRPLGMSGEIKVSDFLINEKVSLFDKGEIVILCDEEKIVWICGRRLDNRVKIEPSTRRVLKLTISPIG